MLKMLLKGFPMADFFNNETIIWQFHKNSEEFNFKEQIQKVTVVRTFVGQ